MSEWMSKRTSEWMSKRTSEWTSERSWMSKIQTCRYKEIMLLGMRTEAGIRLEVDKHAGEP